ncbi:hypothetical protein [Glycomyces buryatensis]|uniref:Uncharacterized protein n=1 Tax=Glycomyces buryatensis TaxID=2570927 RepID=A0A4S8Q5W4_9ACTN|nr:hypothetical protein [Glycomyces buryatensis]THV39653.1 hypothetical protein FAB82_17440 [Glycomyces buryatensis]
MNDSEASAAEPNSLRDYDRARIVHAFEGDTFALVFEPTGRTANEFVIAMLVYDGARPRLRDLADFTVYQDGKLLGYKRLADLYGFRDEKIRKWIEGERETLAGLVKSASESP